MTSHGVTAAWQVCKQHQTTCSGQWSHNAGGRGSLRSCLRTFLNGQSTIIPIIRSWRPMRLAAQGGGLVTAVGRWTSDSTTSYLCLCDFQTPLVPLRWCVLDPNEPLSPLGVAAIACPPRQGSPPRFLLRLPASTEVLFYSSPLYPPPHPGYGPSIPWDMEHHRHSRIVHFHAPSRSIQASGERIRKEK